MAVAEPDTEVLEEVELLFGKPSRELTLAEEAKYRQYQAKWDEQDQLEHEQHEKIARANEEYNAKWQVKQGKQKQKWEKAARVTDEYDAHLQARKKADEDEMEQQRNLLLAQKAAKETVSQMDIEHEQALVVKECRAAELREMDKITQACLEQYEDA